MTLLDAEVAAFLTSNVAIIAASRNDELMPSVARGCGCTVQQNPPLLRVLVSSGQAEELLRDVAATRMIAATFSLPSTHRTLQFKGTDARITPLQEGDGVTITSYLRGFMEAVAPLGHSGEFARAIFRLQGDEIAIEFTPSDAFLQTPGPRAGSRL